MLKAVRQCLSRSHIMGVVANVLTYFQGEMLAGLEWI